jgi:hypothetical protein
MKQNLTLSSDVDKVGGNVISCFQIDYISNHYLFLANDLLDSTSDNFGLSVFTDLTQLSEFLIFGPIIQCSNTCITISIQTIHYCNNNNNNNNNMIIKCAFV